MSASLLVTIGWVLAISFVGMLPRSQHRRFGFPLLALFPFVLFYLGWQMGIYWALGLLAAGVSIFRYPARYFGRILWHKLTHRDAP